MGSEAKMTIRLVALVVFLVASVAHGQFDDVSNWVAFDPGEHGVGNDPDSYSGVVFDGRYVYFIPSHNGTEWHGEVLRYDTTGTFSEASSWTGFDPGTHDVGTEPDGYEGAVFDGRYLYFGPVHNNTGWHGEVLRYDTQGDFTRLSSWRVFNPDLNGVGSNPRAYNGGIFDGRYLYFVPMYNDIAWRSEVLRYDTVWNFVNTFAWDTFDARDAGVADPRGRYDGAVFDGRYVYFAPDNDSSQYGEVLRYDTGLPQPVPAVSEWGLAGMTLLLLTAGTAMLRARRDGTTGGTTLKAAMAAVLIAGPIASDTVLLAQVEIEWVVVGDVGNAADSEVMCTDGTTGYGSVDYVYQISKYEVTNTQYREFLNAIAAVGDPNGLYKPLMADTTGGIVRTGSGTTDDPWVYGPRDDDPNWNSKPVNFLHFYDTLRFANWMHNGQPAGAQDASTTEDGAYDMSLGRSVVRKEGARVFLPSEDEWYKAAFYKAGGPNSGYWNYATQGNMLPISEPPPGRTEPPRSANYNNEVTGFAVGPPYYATDVGAYTYSPSAYDTFDQTGNVHEWVEADVYGDGSYRVVLGGAWMTHGDSLSACWRHRAPDTFENWLCGFRLASVSQPGAIPTVSGWGMVVMVLILLTAGCIAVASAKAVDKYGAQRRGAKWMKTRGTVTVLVAVAASVCGVAFATYGQDTLLDCPVDSLFAQPPDAGDAGTAFVSDDEGVYFIRYDSFSGISQPICNVHWWGSSVYNDGSGWQTCTEDPMPFAITFYEDTSGRPGAEVCSYAVDLSGTLAGIGLGWDLLRYEVVLGTCCNLTDGWISIVGSGDPLCWFMWRSSPTPDRIVHRYLAVTRGMTAVSAPSTLVHLGSRRV